ncbi:MAG TPA: PEP-CTERM sorting domain-containing protein [Gemmatimonadaceae bacterium]|nr:PEP-CTERM sorting domain-containing protein [Gemmatimonadaceae bacterium]
MTLTRMLAGCAALTALQVSAGAQQVQSGFERSPGCVPSAASYRSWVSLLESAGCSVQGTKASAQEVFRSRTVVYNGMHESALGGYFVPFLAVDEASPQLYPRDFSGKHKLPGAVNNLPPTPPAPPPGGPAGPPPGGPLSGPSSPTTLPANLPAPGTAGTNIVNQPNAAPEPATLLLVATGIGGVAAMARRRRQARGNGR